MSRHTENCESGENAAPGNGLIRRLAGRYLIVLAVVAGLVVVDQAVIQPMLARVSWYAPVINVAGRQRMLSQKLAKAALALESASEEEAGRRRRSELRETLLQWLDAHIALREGSSERGIQRIESAEIEREWEQLSPHFDAMCRAANQIVREGNMLDPQEQIAATEAIVEHEAAFLSSMERIVKLMEYEAAAAIARLRFCAAIIAAAVIACLLALGWWVIRPATSIIRRQLEELEWRVADRTRELSSTLASLRHEIAAREKSERRNQRLASELAHASRVSTMGHLAGGLAHEVNQPLATIANYVEACGIELDRMEDGPIAPRLRNYLDLTRKAALRAGQIVRRIRNFIRPIEPSVTDVEINDLVREVVEFCRIEADHAGSEIALRLTERRASVAADAIQIQQVLVNLVQNALQAMRNCSASERRIDIATDVLSDSVRVEVADTGPGYGAIDADAIFAPFFTTKHDGLGIGLSICRTIVEQHAGTIWAEAAAGRGAKVCFTLPLSENNVESERPYAECVCR